MRKKEIDLLEWSSFRWDENVIRIEATRYFHPKSENSIADLPVDREAMTLFRGYHKRAKGPFVIKSKRAPLPTKPRQHIVVTNIRAGECMVASVPRVDVVAIAESDLPGYVAPRRTSVG